VNHNPQWVKVIDHHGHVEHVDWTLNYDKMRAAAGYTYPGYMIFESGAWCADLKKWFFLPRRASHEKYDEKLDERRATNILIESDESFVNIKHRTIGMLNQVRGYSSIKFVPDLSSDSIVVSIKSEEDSGKISAYLSVFNAQSGHILLKDTIVSDKYKYEGVEFI
jgi:soluble calcium-activated nucleotidase 1